MSPPVPLGSEEDVGSPSGLKTLTKGEYRALMRARDEAAKEREAAAREKKWARNAKIALGSFVGTAFAAAVATDQFSAWAQRKIDAGTAPVAADVVELRKEVKEELKAIRTEIKEGQQQDNKRWEAILWKLKVPDPAPRRDGGDE